MIKHLIEFNRLIENMKNRPSMYVGSVSFFKITNFLEGYMFREKELSSIDISQSFQNWLKIKKKREFAFHWSSYIYEIIAKQNEQKAIDLLFLLLEEFVNKYEKNKDYEDELGKLVEG